MFMSVSRATTADAVRRSTSDEGDAAMLARAEANDASTLATELVLPVGLPATSIAYPVRIDANDAAKEAACGEAACGFDMSVLLYFTFLSVPNTPRPGEKGTSRYGIRLPANSKSP